MADFHMTEPEETEIELIFADETTQEFDIGEAPQDDDDDIMEDKDDEIRDDADMVYHKHSGPVYSIKVNPLDPRMVITGGGDDAGVIWNLENGNILYKLLGHQDSIVSVDFNHDGKYAATGGYDGVVKVWDVATGNQLTNLVGPTQEIEWICWHKKGDVVLAGSGDGTVWMWLATTGECMHVFAGHEDGVTCGTFTGSGKMIVTGSTDCTVRVWNPKTGECNHVFRGHGFHAEPVTFVVCHSSQPLSLSGSQDGTACLTQVQTKRILATLSHVTAAPGVPVTISDTTASTGNSVECGGFCNTMNWAATGCLGGYVRIWDLGTYQAIDNLHLSFVFFSFLTCTCRHTCRHPAGVIKLLWHPTLPTVYACTVEGLIYVWDARTGKLLKSLAGHSDMVLDMTFIPDVNDNSVVKLLTASDDESVRLYQV
ncbi:uncharacterized protein CCR75_003099 [Bremia lactucae]|uniref:Angio-associated migratory cell protein n=1 Tax=Bremia lactucae TaxID=4779 RepID=A0A976IJN8_BRELC|nr:hypothetical protein CCR75_003099 [Bremia lactucae]